jgi:hypothetical protein
MSMDTVTIDLVDGEGERDISNYLMSAIPTDRLCSESFKRAAQECSFLFIYSAELLALLAQMTSSSPIRLYRDGECIFTGRIPPTISLESNGAGLPDPDVSPISIDAEDLSILLDREITADDEVAYRNYFVCDPANPGISITHRLLGLAGISGAVLDITEIERTTLLGFAKDSGTVGDALDELLYEYGMVLRQKPDGSFMVFRWLVETPEAPESFDESKIIAPLRAERIEREADAVEVAWNALKEKEDCLVYMADLPYGDDNQRSGYPIQPGLLWPEESNVEDTWFDYQDTALAKKVSTAGTLTKNTDFTQIVMTRNHYIDSKVDAGVLVSVGPFFQNMRGRVAYSNPTAGPLNIYYCDIYADAIYRAAENLVTKNIVEPPSKTLKVTALHLHDSVSATRFACALADLVYGNACWRYTFSSETKFALGAVGSLSDPYSGIATTAIIIERTLDPETDLYSYKAISVAPVIINPTATYVAIPPVSPTSKSESLNNRVDNLPTYAALQQGYNRSGGTTTPDVPSIIAQSGFRAVTLVSDKQAALTNLAAYEWQVAPSAAGPWYSLRWDGFDYKGSEGSWTSSPGEAFVHPNIPLAGTASDPLARVLWYRARRLTKAALRSEWSTPVQGVASQIQTGDIAANAVTANKLAAGIVETLQAVIEGDVIIDKDRGFLAGDSGEVDGNQQAHLTEEEVAFQRYYNGAWHTLVKLALEGLYAQQCYSDGPLIISNGTNATRRARGFDLGRPYPSNAARVYHLDGDIIDQLGVAGWTIDGNYSFDAADFAILAMAPFTVGGACMIGAMSLTMSLGAELFGDWWVDFWVKLPEVVDNFDIVSVGNSTDGVRLRFLESAIEYTDPGTSGETEYTDPAASGEKAYTSAKADTDLSIVVMRNGVPSSTRKLIGRSKWVHVALGYIAASNELHAVLGDENVNLGTLYTAGAPAMSLVFNGGKTSSMKFDEVFYDVTKPINVATSIAQSSARIPWAALDYTTRRMYIDPYDRVQVYGLIGPDDGLRCVGDPNQPAFQNGWKNHADFINTAFMKTADGFVYLQGVVVGGTADSVIFTLPVGYRPPKSIVFACVGAAAVKWLYVYPDGRVQQGGGAAVDFEFFAQFYVGW